MQVVLRWRSTGNREGKYRYVFPGLYSLSGRNESPSGTGIPQTDAG